MLAASGSSTSDSSDSDAGKQILSLLMGVEVVTEDKRAHCTPTSLEGGFILTWSPVMHIIAIIMYVG